MDTTTMVHTRPMRQRQKVTPSLPQRLKDDTGVNTLLNVDDLHVDHTYQRAVDNRHVETIAREFDLKKIFRIAVNQRPDGSYWIIDGQQRVAAVKLLGGNYMIDCVLYHLDTVEKEAALYYHLNWDRKNPTALDRWRARLAQGEADVVRIQDELDNARLKLANAGEGIRSIRAVGTVNKWVDYDVEALSVVIMLLGKFEYLEPVAVEVFSGLLYTEHHLRQRSSSLTRARSNKETYIHYLLGRGYVLLREAANTYQSERSGLGGGSTVAKKAAKGIVQFLNFNMKANRLPLISD